MDEAHFDRIMAARAAIFGREGRVLTPSTLTYEAGKSYVLFPDIRCFHCDSSLVTRAKAGLFELRVKIARRWTRLHLSIFLEDYFIGLRDAEVEFAVGEALAKVTCPHCASDLFHPGAGCRRCRAPLIRLETHCFDERFFVMNVCARRGCRSHYLELGSLEFERFFLGTMPLRTPGDFAPLELSGRLPERRSGRVPRKPSGRIPDSECAARRSSGRLPRKW